MNNNQAIYLETGSQSPFYNLASELWSGTARRVCGVFCGHQR